MKLPTVQAMLKELQNEKMKMKAMGIRPSDYHIVTHAVYCDMLAEMAGAKPSVWQDPSRALDILLGVSPSTFRLNPEAWQPKPKLK